MTFLVWSSRLTTRVCSQDIHLASVVEVLQSIKQSDMTPLLGHIYASPSGSALLDVLMKYLYAPSPHSPPIQSPHQTNLTPPGPLPAATKACRTPPPPPPTASTHLTRRAPHR